MPAAKPAGKGAAKEKGAPVDKSKTAAPKGEL